jgi:small-conductance mechanosensitive channel
MKRSMGLMTCQHTPTRLSERHDAANVYHAGPMQHPARTRVLTRLLLVVAVGLLLASGALAAERTLADVEKSLQEVAEELATLDARVAETGPTPATAAQREQLEALERTYLRQRDVLRDEQALEAREKEAEQRLASGPSGQLAQPPPYLLQVLDALADARDAQRKRGETLTAAVEAAKQAKEVAVEALDSAEKARRREAEAAEKAKDEAEGARLRQALARAEAESRIARARRDLAALELATLERKLAVQSRDEQLLDETVRWVRENLTFDQQDESAQRDALGDREFEARRSREFAEREVASAERSLAEAERRLEKDPGSPVRTAEVAARQAELELWQRRVEMSTTSLGRIEAQRTLEAHRVQALSGEVSRSRMLEWKDEIEAQRAEIQRNLRLLEVQQQEITGEIRDARAALADAPDGAASWIQRQVDAYEAIRSMLVQDAAQWSQIDTLAGRVLAEIEEITARPSLRDRLGDLAHRVRSAWQFELFAVEDRPITVGKISTGLLLFMLGFVVARLVSRVTGRLLVRRTALATGAATAIQGLLFYLLVILFFLIALRSVNIPLTAFTVLGGALAIGVGFGSQNIVNNFISGLILLAERPIKVGDMIEVEGQRGHVEWIGARSTRVRTFDNIHIIVPNSLFLEKSVINWTLADDDVRTKVDVGVAYGSPTEQVKALLERAVGEHEKVLDAPPPTVLFFEFGDSALIFRTYFWIRSRNMGERLGIESDIRYRVDLLCREAGITIAFPQRDVHLDASRPLPVRMVEGPAGER